MLHSSKLEQCIEKLRSQATSVAPKSPLEEELWSQFYQLIYPAIAFYLVSVGAKRDSLPDVIQSSFMKFLASSPWSNDWKRLPDPPVVIRWIKTTSRNALRDSERKTAREIFDGEENLEEQVAPEPIGSELDGLNEFMSTLSPEDQLLIVYRLMGFSLKEISENLGITVSAAGTRFHRLKQKLQEM